MNPSDARLVRRQKKYFPKYHDPAIPMNPSDARLVRRQKTRLYMSSFSLMLSLTSIVISCVALRISFSTAACWKDAKAFERDYLDFSRELQIQTVLNSGHVVEGEKIWDGYGDLEVGMGALVPGNAGLRYCRLGEEEMDLGRIEYIHLDPYPPVPGQNLTIVAEGFLHEPVNEGAMVHLLVKIGWIILINRPYDLCEQSDTVLNITCPIPRGPIKVTKEIMVPAAIPPGEIMVMADVKNDDGADITCLWGKMRFH